MKNQDEQIDKLFKNGLSSYYETPSSSAWSSIETQLSKKNTQLKYWVAASVAAVIISSVMAWNNFLAPTKSIDYEMASTALQVNYPQKQFIPVPILIHTTTIVYIEKEAESPKTVISTTPDNISIDNPTLVSSFDIKPLANPYNLNTEIANLTTVNLVYTPDQQITIIYKKGDPKRPKLAKAASFLRQVREGERPLIDFEKLSTGLMARRETTNNSNN
ncbi:MAG: hypothetical protein L3J29_11240 [Cyclobacteriaceae bacterium]|nr:hypothetical protein [Cyclobacteriaceae bacterium]